MNIAQAIKTLRTRHGTGNLGYERLSREFSTLDLGYFPRAELWNVEHGKQSASKELIAALEKHPDIDYKHPRRFRMYIDFPDQEHLDACYDFYEEVFHQTPQEALREEAALQLRYDRIMNGEDVDETDGSGTTEDSQEQS